MRENDYLVAEIDRLKEELAIATSVAPVGSRATLYTSAVVSLAVVDILAVVAIFMVRPDKDNTIIIGTIQVFVIPIVTAFLAGAVNQVHAMVNSRLTQLLRATEKASFAGGRSAAEGEMRARADILEQRRGADAVVAKAVVTAAELAATPVATTVIPVVPVVEPTRR